MKHTCKVFKVSRSQVTGYNPKLLSKALLHWDLVFRSTTGACEDLTIIARSFIICPPKSGNRPHKLKERRLSWLSSMCVKCSEARAF